MDNVRVLVVIPAHDEEKTIAQVLENLRRVAPTYDRLVVNDGSRDATDAVVTALGEKQLRLLCNVGYGHALQIGFRYALLRGYDIVVTLDADGQHQPEEVPRLVDALLETGADLVIGSRFCDGLPYTSPFGRRVGQLMFSVLTRLFVGRRIYDTTSGFKALRASVCRVIVDGTFMDYHTETIVRLSLMNFKIVEAPITIRERTYGRSMHSFPSVFRYPVQTFVLTIVAAIDVFLTRRST
jgi:glycosyltransferase involved in cell wall biosynthesis